jgi:TonB family protein
MNRLQKKCFIATTGFHLLLLLILFVGPAFLAPGDRFKNLQTIDVIPPNIVEGALARGGTPNATPPPPMSQTPAPPTQPQPQPQRAQPEKIVRPEPVKDIKPTNPDPDSLEIKTEKKPRKPEVSTTIVTRKPNSRTPVKTPANSDADAQKRERTERRQAFNSTIQSLRDSLSSSTSVGIPGEGGEAYAGYDVIVQSIYQARYDQELLGAGGIAGNHAEVEVSVTIARNGDVISTRIVNPSENSALNKLVQRVLDKVTFVRPFPAAAKDQQRTFTIVFELKPKKAAG